MPSAPLRTGDTAPQLRLPTIDGVPFDLAAARGHHVLVSFLRHAG
jgi:peroxiredoxin